MKSHAGTGMRVVIHLQHALEHDVSPFYLGKLFEILGIWTSSVL